jgi:hypothetical protein
MKTRIILLSSIFFFATITSHAQINKGRYLLGGSFSYSDADNPAAHYLSTNIQFGKVIKENTIVGVTGSIMAAKYNSSQKNTIDQYSVGLFYRKYKPLKNNFYFFGELNGTYQYVENEMTYFPNINQSVITKTNGVSAAFIPGISYAVWKRLQMELTMPNLLTISYRKTKSVDSSLPPAVSSQEANNFAFNANLNSNLLNNFAVGFKFLLGK